MAYTLAAEDLFMSKSTHPSIEFVNQLTSDAIQAIHQDSSIERIIERHTMFPYYGRFLPKERREKHLRY